MRVLGIEVGIATVSKKKSLPIATLIENSHMALIQKIVKNI